jgi:hypothetical protein
MRKRRWNVKKIIKLLNEASHTLGFNNDDATALAYIDKAIAELKNPRWETPEKWEAEGWVISNGPCLENTVTNVRIVNPIFWAKPLAEMGFFHQYTVPADRELQEMMVSRYERFWDKYVLPGIPPEPQNYDDIKRLYTEPKSTLIVPENIERLLAEYGQIGEEAGKQKKRQEQIKVKVLDWARKQEGGVIDDESAEALILRNSRGEKAGSFSKNKNGTAVFRA